MAADKLYQIFTRLNQGSGEAVQSGQSLTDLDEYMHVSRPIEGRLKEKMRAIDEAGGGIAILVGSAGDGKSHLISKVRGEFDWENSCYYNDATASSSPKRTAIDTLKRSLAPFNDANLGTTNKKLLLAINLGKLNAFIDDEEAKSVFSRLVEASAPIFSEDATDLPVESEKVKFILFTHEQIFEFHPNSPDEYPVDSVFLNTLLEKIVAPSRKNPFYAAYLADLEAGNEKDPLLLNYELLMKPEIRNTIVKSTIEAIVRFNLVITPREFLDFIFSITVYADRKKYVEKDHFYNALLPTLLYTEGTNPIHRAVSKLDPLKTSNLQHDKDLSILSTSFDIPSNIAECMPPLPDALVKRTQAFYSNNGKDIWSTTQFLFRLSHLCSYHSESTTYKEYLQLLAGIFTQRKETLKRIYNLVERTMPRHYGSYYNSKADMIPTSIQGGSYRMFVRLEMAYQKIRTTFSEAEPNVFPLHFDLEWIIGDGHEYLEMNYGLYSYLVELDRGKLAVSYENERDMVFDAFLRRLSKRCTGKEAITIVGVDEKERTLSEDPFGDLILK